MATTTMNLQRLGNPAQEFEDTRPTLYFSPHTWAHLNAVRRLSRSAANDAVRPQEPEQPLAAEAFAAEPEPLRDFTTAAWPADDEDAAPAALAPMTAPDGLHLANLAGLAVVAVCAMAAAGFLLG